MCLHDIFPVDDIICHFANSFQIKLSFKGNIKLMVIIKIENGTSFEQKIEKRTIEWTEFTIQIPDTNLR